METAIMMNSMCRCCASEGVYKDVKTRYKWMGEEEVYADMLTEIFDINLSTSENGEDGGICEVCITQLRNAANFKKQVLHTEEQFKKHVNNKLFKPSIVKVEALMDEDNDSDDNNISAEEGYSGTEYDDVPIKQEEEPKPRKRAAAKATTSRAKKAKSDNGESSSKRGPKADTSKVTAEKKSILRSPSSEVTTRFKTDLLKTRGMKFHQPELKKLQLIKHRSNIREVILWSNATPIRRYEGMDYMCCYCNNHYLDPIDLKNHTLETHQDVNKAYFMVKVTIDKFIIRLDITSLQCNICKIDLDTLEQLLDHLKAEHQKPIYTDIKNHIIPFKFDTEILRCCICLNTFSKFKMLLEHMSIHYRNYICDVCDVGFINSYSLRCHKRIHESGTFKCDHCSLVFDTNVKRNAHVRTMHSSKRVSKCMYCNEVFKDYRKKEEHLVMMHGLKVPTPECQACERVFKNRKVLNLHIKRDHLLDRRHKCLQCGMEFFRSKALTDHMLKHTGLRSFTCTVCSKAYSTAKNLKAHMKIHDDVRRFKCEYCGQAFVQKCSWRIHMRSKHGEIV